MPRPRVALLWSGHLRGHDRALEHHRKWLFEVLQPDLFLHTWDKDESTTPSWWRKPGTNVLTFDTDAAALREMYAPYLKGLEVERQYDFTHPAFAEVNKASTIQYEHIVSMWYGWWRVFQMMTAYAAENRIAYDMVFRSRPDVAVEPVMELDTQTVVVPVSITCPGPPGIKVEHTGWYCDMFGYGPLDLMHVYCQLFAYRMHYATVARACRHVQSATHQIVPEGVLALYLHNRGVPVRVLPGRRALYRADGTTLQARG